MLRPFITNRSGWRRHSPETSGMCGRGGGCNLVRKKTVEEEGNKLTTTSEQLMIFFLFLICSCSNIQVGVCAKFLYLPRESLAWGPHKSQGARSGAMWAEDHVWFNSRKSEKKPVRGWVSAEEFKQLHFKHIKYNIFLQGGEVKNNHRLSKLLYGFSWQQRAVPKIQIKTVYSEL